VPFFEYLGLHAGITALTASPGPECNPNARLLTPTIPATFDAGGEDAWPTHASLGQQWDIATCREDGRRASGVAKSVYTFT